MMMALHSARRLVAESSSRKLFYKSFFREEFLGAKMHWYRHSVERTFKLDAGCCRVRRNEFGRGIKDDFRDLVNEISLQTRSCDEKVGKPGGLNVSSLTCVGIFRNSAYNIGRACPFDDLRRDRNESDRKRV